MPLRHANEQATLAIPAGGASGDVVNQTLSRTVITAGTTFLSVLSLYIFGGEVLHGFAFTMLVGIVSGTYSTVFIAAAIAIILGNRQGSTATSAGTAVKVKAATARRS